VAHLTGEIDLATAPGVFEAVRAGLDGPSLVIDLTDVAFIDSRGLAAVLDLAREIDVRLVAPPGGEPRRVLEITQLTTAIPTFDTTAAATE
jgi:anti-sigma B factor antagonist